MVYYLPDSANWKRALHDPVLLVLVAYLIITEFDCPFITDGVSYKIWKITILGTYSSSFYYLYWTFVMTKTPMLIMKTGIQKHAFKDGNQTSPFEYELLAK